MKRTLRTRLIFFCLGGLLFQTSTLFGAQTSVRLNELLANGVNLVNSAGNVTDWVELFNNSTASVDLAGASLTDDPTKPRKWTIPAGVAIPANGYRVIFLDGNRAASVANATTLNSGFALKANGDRLYFYASTSENSVLIDTLSFGFQIADLTIGRSPNGSGSWTLNSPTPGAANTPMPLGNPNVLKVNEWMASPASGDDWFEVYNPGASHLDLGGLYTTDTLTIPTLSQVPPLSFVGTGLEGYFRFWASGNTNDGANHVNFRLSNNGESIGIYAAGGVKIDSVTFGSQEAAVSQGRLPDGSAAIASFRTSPTPGEPNFTPLTGLVVNEVLAHTDPPLEDAVEFFNTGTTPIDISGWYLSNQRSDLKKYKIPANNIVPAQGYKVFYEYQFNDPGLSKSFTLNSAHGDEIYLSQADSSGNLTGYRAGEVFEASENGVSFGRYNTSVTGDYKFVAMSNRTFGKDSPGSVAEFRLGTGLPNAYPVVGPIVINELMYHPPDIGTNDNIIDEFLELRNISSSNVKLYDPEYPTNTWRLVSGVIFIFPTGAEILPNAHFLVVSFDPAARPDLLATFRSKYSVAASVPIFGPYAVKLSNGGDPVELYRPDKVQLPPRPDAGFVPYIRVDKVNYSDSPPWPGGADGTGFSIQRKNSFLFGNDPINWQAAAPSAGRANGSEITDGDGDGIPDQYEAANGMNPADARDAGLDPDSDSFTNLQEYIAGTDPRNNASKFKIDGFVPSTSTNTPAKITFTAQAGKSYTVQYRNNLRTGSWQKLKDVPSEAAVRSVTVDDPEAFTRFDRYYRVLTPAN